MKLLITGAWQSAKEQLDALRAMGHEIAFLQQEKDPLPVDPAWVEGVICNGLFLHHPIEAFPLCGISSSPARALTVCRWTP